MSNTYEATRNVLDVKANVKEASSLLISQFDYTVNALGQRDDVNRSGSAFSSANTEIWNYNAKGEVVTADHSTNNGFDRSFEFDGIGNRKKSADSLTLPATDNYTSNALNQYGSIDGNTRSFDDDGNLVDDGSKIYTWDAENRLIAIHQREADGSKGAEVASYGYDFGSRRITKSVAGVETNFVYDFWNPIAVFTGTTFSRSYTWGMDLSGLRQGVGGVGGLLSINDNSSTYYPTFDGNGNVSEYVDSTGAVVAHYEYDVFGQVTASGIKATNFTHQFSTKQLDTESGLHYYGYRYYSNLTARWLKRDPFEEAGGVNLYGFVNNATLSGIDALGLVRRSEATWTQSQVETIVQELGLSFGVSDAGFSGNLVYSEVSRRTSAWRDNNGGATLPSGCEWEGDKWETGKTSQNASGWSYSQGYVQRNQRIHKFKELKRKYCCP